MKEGEMDRVDIPLVPLQIIAAMEDLVDESRSLGNAHELVIRQQGRLSGAQIGEDDPARFPAGIGWLANLAEDVLAPGVPGPLETLAMNVVQPAVVDAPQTTILDSSVAEICAAVTAVEFEKAGAALIISKEDQLLTQELYRYWPSTLRKLLR
jgi:hypothetical protein